MRLQWRRLEGAWGGRVEWDKGTPPSLGSCSSQTPGSMHRAEKGYLVRRPAPPRLLWGLNSVFICPGSLLSAHNPKLQLPRWPASEDRGPLTCDGRLIAGPGLRDQRPLRPKRGRRQEGFRGGHGRSPAPAHDPLRVGTSPRIPSSQPFREVGQLIVPSPLQWSSLNSPSPAPKHSPGVRPCASKQKHQND
jgi:hypothetical protein